MEETPTKKEIKMTEDILIRDLREAEAYIEQMHPEGKWSRGWI